MDNKLSNTFQGVILFLFFVSLLVVFIFFNSFSAKIHYKEVISNEFDPKTLGWVEVFPENIFSKRDSHFIFEFKNKLYLTGGLDGTEQIIGYHTVAYEKAPHFNDIWESSDGISWNRVVSEAEFPKIRSTVVIHASSTLYILGGWSPDEGYKVGVWRSNDALSWQKVKNEPEFGEREGHKIIEKNGEFYLFGGVNYAKGETYNDVWVSKNGLDWKQIQDNSPWASRWDHDVVYFKDKFILTSGMARGGIGYSDIWESGDAINWTLVSSSTPWGKRQGQSFVVWKDRVWFIGGLNTETDEGIGDTWVSNDGINFQKNAFDGAWSGREDHSVILKNDKLILSGGMDENWRWHNDVWVLEKLPCGEDVISKSKSLENLNLTSNTWGVFCLSENNNPFFLAGKNPTDEVGIASITKILTAMIAKTNIPENISIVLDKEDISKGSLNRYSVGESISLKEALSSLLIESDNDIARALIGEDVSGFLSKMNTKAEDIKAFFSVFRNSSGLDIDGNPGNTSTVVDISRIGNKLFTDFPEVFSLTKMKEKEVYLEGGRKRLATTTNKLLFDEGVSQYIVGGKTGETLSSKKNLFLVFEIDGKKYISVVLGSEDHFLDSKKIILELLK